MKYNLGVLSPLEFEELSRDIMSKMLDINLKIYKPGKDGGIDLRNMEEGIICQCKHIQKFSDLKSSLIKEVKKISELKDMKKYYLIVSTRLTPQNEKIIFDIFKDFITSSDQIISCNDIEQFLDDDNNIDVLKKNSKLWLTSYKIIELFQQKYMDFEIQNLLNIIDNCMKYFVETKMFKECYEKLNSDRLLIISGSPGVGKTINSNMLVAKMIANNPELKLKTVTGSNYKEMIESFNKDDLEIIILDDFLGQSYLEKSSDEINEIIKIIDYVKNNSKKYLILNSRLKVLSDVKIDNERFSRLLDSLENNQYMIDMDNVSNLEKAKILFNLHYFNNVPLMFYEELLKKDYWRKRYEVVIENKNYNTRIIEYCVLNYKKDNITHDKYFDYIMNNLNNPKQVWHKQFLCFANEEISYLHIMYSINTSDVPRVLLKECYENVICHRKYDTERTNFNNITEKLSNNLITQKYIDKDYVMNVINPSVNDYLINELKDNIPELKKMIAECIYIEQLINLVNINSSILKNIDFNIFELKSIDNKFESKLLFLIEKYNYCNKDIKEPLISIFNSRNPELNQMVLRILSNKKLVDFYNLEEYYFDVDYIKEMLLDSDNFYNKYFFETLDDYIDYSDEDYSECLKEYYYKLSQVIEDKIEDYIYEDICTTIDEIVQSYEDDIEFETEDDEVTIKNISDIQDLVENDLSSIIEGMIEDEVNNYLLNIIKFENLNPNIDNCYDYSYIEQSIYEFIQNKNKVKDESNDIDGSYSIHDVFFQEYKLEE